VPTSGTASAATGLVAMVLLTAVVVLGIVVNRRVRLPPKARYAGLGLHRQLSLLAVAFLAVHILTALAGPYGGLGWNAVVVPFTSERQRLWLGLGTVAFDLLVAVVVTSLVRRRIGRRYWRAVHWLAYVCWPIALAHSIGSGAGMRSGRPLDVAVGSVVMVVIAAGWRLASALWAMRQHA
jgi:methionine sulfoxide reductase heme-binding subunit